MKKRLIAMTLTAAALASLCACGVDKPDLNAVSEQPKSSEGSSAKETGIQTITRNGSHIKGNPADLFNVDAEIENEKTSMPTYYLNRINLTEDQIAGILMSIPDYKREDKEDGVVAYVNDNEKLVIDLGGKLSDGLRPSPNLTYGLDKGKEYESVVKDCIANDDPEDEESSTAVGLVKAKLDKLSIEYCDAFKVKKHTLDDLNGLYSDYFRSFDQPDLSYKILLNIEGNDAKYDKDFKFTKDDNCVVVTGNLKLNDMEISGIRSNCSSITAAVSSRGIEYLYIEDLYTPDSGSSDSKILTSEQAVKAVYKNYDTSPVKDKYKVKINEIILDYRREDESSKVVLRPVWIVYMDISYLGEDDKPVIGSGEIYADTGEPVEPFSWDENFEDYIKSLFESEEGG